MVKAAPNSSSDIASTALSSEERIKVADHFNRLKDQAGCHICGNQTWWPHPNVYTPIIFDRVGNHHRTDKLRPMVAVQCFKCGTVTFFDAKVVGVPHVRPKDDENGS